MAKGSLMLMSMDGGTEKLRVIMMLRMMGKVQGTRKGAIRRQWDTVGGPWGGMDGGALEGETEQQCLNKSGGERVCRWRGVNFSFTMAMGSKACFSLCGKTKANVNWQHVIILGK
ncbi:hypothetical protein EDC04DRAFT_2600291 [Pisolithus marmoratus]|nr:hypothetical protein EDC04DRAFT_2600291 [Pisolithus marmoratus]